MEFGVMCFAVCVAPNKAELNFILIPVFQDGTTHVIDWANQRAQPFSPILALHT